MTLSQVGETGHWDLPSGGTHLAFFLDNGTVILLCFHCHRQNDVLGKKHKKGSRCFHADFSTDRIANSNKFDFIKLNKHLLNTVTGLNSSTKTKNLKTTQALSVNEGTSEVRRSIFPWDHRTKSGQTESY